MQKSVAENWSIVQALHNYNTILHIIITLPLQCLLMFQLPFKDDMYNQPFPSLTQAKPDGNINRTIP